jgi:hypothetical protein
MRRCDLLQALALHVVQGPRDALARREAIERAVDLDDELLLFGRRAPVGQPVVAGIGVEVHERPEAAKLQLSQAAPHGDLREPAFDLALVGAAPQAVDGGREHVLHHVFDFGRPAQHARGERADVARVALVERFEARVGPHAGGCRRVCARRGCALGALSVRRQ